MLISAPYAYLAAAGLDRHAVRVATLGNNPSIDTATQPEDVWSGASIGILNGYDHKFIPKPQAALAMEVLSDNANDTSAGTGARTVIIGYLNADYVSKTTVRVLNGVTPVAITENVMRVNSVIVVTAGTYGGNNIGNISVRAAGGAGSTYSYMQAGYGLARSSMYTVPDDNTFDILSLLLSVNRTDTQDRWGTFTLCVQNQAGRLIKGIELSASTVVPYRHEAADIPLNVVAAKTDVWIRCEAVSQNSTNVTAGLFGVQRQGLPISII
jgi:hypothetical protein